MLAQKKLSDNAWKLYRDVETKLLHLEPQGLFQKDMASALTELKRGGGRESPKVNIFA